MTGCIGDYEGLRGTCAERQCQEEFSCKGQCGCEACRAAYADFLSSPGG